MPVVSSSPKNKNETSDKKVINYIMDMHPYTIHNTLYKYKVQARKFSCFLSAQQKAKSKNKKQTPTYG